MSRRPFVPPTFVAKLFGVRIVGRMGNDPVLRHLAGEEPWNLVRLRKECRCCQCGREMVPGDVAFRPLGNQSYRFERICRACVAAIPDVSKAERTKRAADGYESAWKPGDVRFTLAEDGE